MSLPEPGTTRVSTNWDDYRFVRAVAQTRSLVGAADQLGVNHSTVFRRINAVEEALGARLFERGRNGYTLTAAGEEMVALAARMSDEITGFERRIAGRDIKPSGELRVTIGDLLVQALMLPVFASFMEAFPDIRLDLIVSNVPLNLAKREADVAIRTTTNSPPETLVGRKVGSIGWAVYGQAGLLGRDFSDLLDERWIGIGENLAHLPTARWIETNVQNDRIVMRVNTVLGLQAAIETGAGISLLPCHMGDSLPGVAKLSDVLGDLSTALWLLTHPDLRQSARVRAFMDHAWETLSRRKTLLEGRPA